MAATGAANLASVMACLGRAGARAELATTADRILSADFAVLPGVGAFGPAMERLAASGLEKAFAQRVRNGGKTLGICLGMQLFCASSEEAPGVQGIGVVDAEVTRFPEGLPLPQLGWNRVVLARGQGGGHYGAGSSGLEAGWAYFANSYRVAGNPRGFKAWTSSYGGEFVAALEGVEPWNEGLLLCQFHPELSGPWGLSLIRRWLGMEARLPQGSGAAQGSTDIDAAGTALRIIPCLDLKNGRVVKGTRFEGLVDSGDPLDLALRYEAEGADELAMLDITATVEGRASSLEALRRVRARLGIPIVMGGGLRREEDAVAMIEAGADRVAINSAAVADPEIIDRLARRFGVQCIVLAVDARRVPGPNDINWDLVVEAGRRSTGLDPVAWAAEGARRGAGEILLTSIDRDGTGSGYDLELIGRVSRAAGIPVVASGGAAGGEAGMRHFEEAARAGARAILAAGAFHRGELAIGDLKNHLSAHKQGVRS